MIELLNPPARTASPITLCLAAGGFHARLCARHVRHPAPEVIGSTVAYRFVAGDGGTIVQRGELDVIDDGGQTDPDLERDRAPPILAAGNSDGDLPMLAFAGGPRRRRCPVIVHDDGDREFEYAAGAEGLERGADAGAGRPSASGDWRKVFRREPRRSTALMET
jgi:hypothetical protein